ncbi:MAG: NifU family protein [Verrucomicrobia bacterium]|nr:NifU family protein [Verrucomicrobiota bacterium]
MSNLRKTNTGTRAESDVTAWGQTPRHPENGRSSPNAPTIIITENALKYISEMRENLGLPVKGFRVTATPRSPLRADFAMRFVPAEEPESPTDVIQSFDGLDLYIAPSSASYLDGATIDFVFRLIGSELKVLAPLRKLDTPDGRIASRIQQVLAEQVNPSLAMHGGSVALIEVMDGIAFLELTGGCQGCSMADSTMKQGIETSIRQGVPEVREVRDVTDHANGRNPYFSSKKSFQRSVPILPVPEQQAEMIAGTEKVIQQT